MAQNLRILRIRNTCCKNRRRLKAVSYPGEVFKRMGRVLVEIEDPEGHPDPRTVHCGVQSTKLSLHKGEEFKYLFLSITGWGPGYKKWKRKMNREDQVHIWKKNNFCQHFIKKQKKCIWSLFKQPLWKKYRRLFTQNNSDLGNRNIEQQV